MFNLRLVLMKILIAEIKNTITILTTKMTHETQTITITKNRDIITILITKMTLETKTNTMIRTMKIVNTIKVIMIN